MRDIRQLYSDWRNATREYRKLTTDTPRITGVVCVKVMNENFDAQGWCENVGAVQRWKKRSKTTDYIYDNDPRYKGSVYRSGNPILRQTGNLKASVKYQVSGANKVEIGVNLNDVPYAKLMNEGGAAVIGTRVVKIPKRQFLGVSNKMKSRIAEEIQRRRDRIFNIFRI